MQIFIAKVTCPSLCNAANIQPKQPPSWQDRVEIFFAAKPDQDSQNHKMVKVARDPWRSSALTP